MMDKELTKLKTQKLIEITNGFCGEHLDQEYRILCRKLIEKMARKRSVPFLFGREEIWAASVIYAVGSINFLFDRSFKPYVSADDICGYFGTSKSTTGQKAGAIRKMFRLQYWDKDFSTQHMAQDNPFADIAMMDGFFVTKDNFS